jgi:indole-3-glycerol phosphate synthase
MLEMIVERKKADLEKDKKIFPISLLQRQPLFAKERRDFKAALMEPGLSIIGELKRASPSKGLIREDFSPSQLAASLERGGANALSVLTDEPFFKGSLNYLAAARRVSTLPLLRKDFLIDPYQLYEARAYGADAVLLITSLLSPAKLKALIDEAADLGLAALVEIHEPAELEIALDAGAGIIGINHRNLKTFELDMNLGESLIKLIPSGKVVIAESGISRPVSLRRLAQAGFDGVLIGEALMKSPSPEEELKKIRKLISK